MHCQFPGEHVGRLDAAVTVQCLRCGEPATATVFPIRRKCSAPEPGPPPPAPRRELTCRHRGGEVRRSQCAPCGGGVALKVYACDVHGECTLGKRLPDVPGCCQGCPSVALGVPGAVGARTDEAVNVICHNDGRFLAEAIPSVLVQTLPGQEPTLERSPPAAAASDTGSPGTLPPPGRTPRRSRAAFETAKAVRSTPPPIARASVPSSHAPS